MKQISIKWRMTLWYTAVLLLIVALVLVFLFSISSSVAKTSAESALVALVDRNINEVDFDDGELELDEDFVFYQNGVSALVYSSGGERLAGQPPDNFSSEVAFGEGAVKQVEWSGKTYLVYDRRVDGDEGLDLWVRGVVPADAGEGIVSSLLRVALIALPVLVVLGALGGYLIARRSLRPVEQVRKTAAEIAGSGDLSQRIALGEGKDEVYHLAATFDEMLARLQKSFDNERRFTADVSHELRTPTSVILAQSEYALGHAKTEREYVESLESIWRQAQRTQRLISQLLLLSRIDQGTQPAQFESTDVGALLSEVCAEQQEQHAEKGILLTARIAPGALAVADSSLLAILAGNLIENAYKYNKPGGFVEVLLTDRGERLEIAVRDGGVGMTQQQQQQVFERFYQADPARTESGAGLGLSLVEKIANLHRGEIALSSILGTGSEFTFIFPKNPVF